MLHFAGTESKNTRIQLDPGEEMTSEEPDTNNVCTELSAVRPKTWPKVAVWQPESCC